MSELPFVSLYLHSHLFLSEPLEDRLWSSHVMDGEVWGIKVRQFAWNHTLDSLLVMIYKLSFNNMSLHNFTSKQVQKNKFQTKYSHAEGI